MQRVPASRLVHHADSPAVERLSFLVVPHEWVKAGTEERFLVQFEVWIRWTAAGLHWRSGQVNRGRHTHGRSRLERAFVIILLVLGAGCPAHHTPAGSPSTIALTPTPTKTQSIARAAGGFTLVGHDPLLARGMNAGLAIYSHYAYVGSRTDGSSGHPHPGVLIVDIANPTRPRVVGEIGSPLEGKTGLSSRELRVWPEAHLLIVMNIGCSASLHRCAAPTETTASATILFFDLNGARATAPVLVATYRPTARPHEMFLWADPTRPGRALLYVSTNLPGAGVPSLLVLDISRVRSGSVVQVLAWRGNDQFPDPASVHLHSLSVSFDGTRAYLAFEGAGFLVLDTSALAKATPQPAVRLLTGSSSRASWPGPGPHSAVQIPGTPYVLATDELYAPCPWAWAHVINAADVAHPRLAAEYRLRENRPSECGRVGGSGFAYSSHNPTVAGAIAFVSWHSGGLEAIDLTDPAGPVSAGAFLPRPLPSVATEDPALTSGGDRVAMWSYPIVVGGLIYVVDIRNGLYILRYGGPKASAVAAIAFLEGNSNLGDAARLAHG
jgi:hypothetical protein